MNYFTFEKYKNIDLGFYLRRYTDAGGTLERRNVLIDASGTGFSSESYFNDDWFNELKKSSGVADYVGNSSGGVSVVNTTNSIFDNTLLSRHSHKELQPDISETLLFMDKCGAPDNVVTGYMQNTLKTVFTEKAESYRRMWAVINEKYDPLFNVDVTDTEEHTGSDTTTHDGKDTTTHDGKDSKTTSGSVTDAKNGTETTKDGNNSKTTTNNDVFVFDSNSAIDDTKSETILETEKQLSFNNRSDTKTFNNLKDQTEYDSSLETEYDSSLETAYDSTITRTKQGNQGVTMSQEMLNAELDTWSKIDFVRYVVDDIAQFMLLY